MFERRLKFLLVLMAIPVAAIVARLVQLQVTHADYYQTYTEKLVTRMLEQPPRILPCLRGEITDVRECPLAFNTSLWHISVHYGAISGDNNYLKALAEDMFGKRSPEAIKETSRQIESSCQTIAELTNTPDCELQEIREKIKQRVRRIKKSVSDRLGVETEVKEEEWFYPIVIKELDRADMVKACLHLADYRWIEVTPDNKRMYASEPSMGRLLGRLKTVTPGVKEKDPYNENELTRYWDEDLYGFEGVEALAEQWLRGQRGFEHKDRNGQPIEPSIVPQDGKTFRLTLDLSLQREIYGLLERAVENYLYSTGASAVVLDIPSRQVLALVSYPSFDPNISWDELLLLGKDDPRRPDIIRAVGKYYPPGSTVKPMILAGALSDGIITPETRITCHRYLPIEAPPRTCSGYHNDVDPIKSIKESCNIFYYEVGQLMGVTRLAEWMSRFGLGRLTGIGLLEEKPGRLPTGGGKAVARNTSIGQGELDVTPIQAANMVATVASGVYRSVTIWADDPNPRDAIKLPVPEEYWQIVREGMYRAVNEEGGTAYRYARLSDVGDYVLLGKTGTAEIPGRPEIPEAAHAWFVGYLTSYKNYLKASNEGDLNIAVAVVIEFGGHGGEVAGPVARDIIYTFLSIQDDNAEAGTNAEGAP